MLLRRTVTLLIVLLGGGALVAQAAGIEAITRDTPWRVFLTCGSVVRGTAAAPKRETRGNVPEHTALPPTDWASANYDDSGWGRYGSDLLDTVGGYGFEMPATTALLCLRTRFGISDPAQVKDLMLSLEYRGGIVVYLNGREIARQHLPQNNVDPMMLAEDYPFEAFTSAAGAGLPKMERPATEELERYEMRVRRMQVAIPAAALRKGGNVLALELHRSTQRDLPAGARAADWATVGLCGVRLVSEAGTGVISYADAAAAVHISNATPMDTIASTPGKRQSGFLWWGVTVTPSGLTGGNPFEPLQPIRTLAPRGGVCSGQVVVSAGTPLQNVAATISPLKQAQGNVTIPAGAVQVRYGVQDKDIPFCNGLLPMPAQDASVQPVWVLVDVPRDQAPGWYTGTLTVSVDGKATRVPVQVLVSGWTLTDPRNNASLISLYQSPETLAMYYKVPMWSDEHFALIEKSMQTMAKMGNDVLLVPVVNDDYLGHKTGMVRWVKTANGYEPDFSLLERYLDLQTKVWGQPKIVTLLLWKHDFGTRTWFRGMRSDVVKPCMVTEYDPKTGEMKPMQAPGFGEPGSEEFWKTMIEGVRRVAKAHGIDDRFLLLGEAFDSRPLQPVVDFFQKIEPGMRWQVYSHFDGGEPAVKDGKFICHGGLEVGFRINPNGGSLPEFERNYPKATPVEFRTAQAHRTEIHFTSSPLSYRNVMRQNGTLARIGADFWTIATDERGRRRSLYGCPPNEGWLWRGHVPTLTVPGPDGPAPTSRSQMLLEGLQENELQVQLTRAATEKPEVRARYQALLADRANSYMVGAVLPQAMISLDWYAMSAREYALGAELAGERSEGEWATPPAVTVE